MATWAEAWHLIKISYTFTQIDTQYKYTKKTTHYYHYILKRKKNKRFTKERNWEKEIEEYGEIYRTKTGGRNWETQKNRERQNKKVLKKNAVSQRQDMIDRTMFTGFELKERRDMHQ